MHPDASLITTTPILRDPCIPFTLAGVGHRDWDHALSPKSVQGQQSRDLTTESYPYSWSTVHAAVHAAAFQSTPSLQSYHKEAQPCGHNVWKNM